MEKELSDRVLNIKSAFQNMLYADSDYWNIDDENVISVINSLYGSIDAEFIKENQLFSKKALQTFESDFVSLFNNDATKQAMVDFYTPITDDETVQEYTSRIKSSLETVQAYCNENDVAIPINFDDSEQTINDLEAQYQRAVDFAKDKFDGYDPTEFFKEHSINTQEEIDVWQEIAQGARDAAEAEKEYLSQDSSPDNETTISFTEAFNSADFSSAKEKLLELAAAGELTPETISSTEEYSTLLTKTGLSAEDACESINKTVSAAQRLNHTASGLSSLTDLYKQANEDGFVDIESLYKLDDAFKNLDSYNEFVEIVGSGTHEMGEMQQAFDKLSSEYLEHTKVLDGLNESNKNLYIQQLKSYGIANAQEIVSKRLSEIDYSDAINSYFNANKGSEGWCNSQQKLNNLLKNETGSTLADFTDGNYEAQVSLLNESEASDTCRKAVAELQLAQIKFNQTRLSVDENIESLARYASAWGLTGTSAQAAYDQMKRVKEMQEGGAEGVGLMYTPEQLEDMYNDAQNRTDAHFAKLLKDDTTSASYNGDDDYRKEQAEKAKKESEKSKEIFDWIETKINRLKTVISELGETASNTFKSLAERASAYGNEISKVTEEIQLQKDAYSKYMEKAGSVGLSEEWASKVRDGSLDISEITDDTLKEQIKDYQTW